MKKLILLFLLFLFLFVSSNSFASQLKLSLNKSMKCDAYGDRYYAKPKVCDQIKECVRSFKNPHNTSNKCNCYDLLIKEKLNTRRLEALILQDACKDEKCSEQNKETKRRGERLTKLYEDYNKLKEALKFNTSLLKEQLPTTIINGQRCDEEHTSLPCNQSEPSSCSCYKANINKSIQAIIDQIVKIQPKLGLTISDESPDSRMQIQLNLDVLQHISSCTKAEQRNCETDAKTSETDNTKPPQCALPKEPSYSANLFPPETPIKTLMNLQRIKKFDENPSQFTKDKIGNFLCKTVPDRVEKDGYVTGAKVPRSIEEVEDLFKKYGKKDLKLLDQIIDLKRHPCFNEVTEKSYYCKQLNVGCNNTSPIRTDQILKRLDDMNKYSCLQSMCETMPNGYHSLFLTPMFDNVLKSLKMVNRESIVPGKDFKSFCETYVHKKAGSYIPGEKVENPYLKCDNSFKESSVNLLFGSRGKITETNLRCFESLNHLDKPKGDPLSKENIKGTLLRCLPYVADPISPYANEMFKRDTLKQLKSLGCYKLHKMLSGLTLDLSKPEQNAQKVISHLEKKYKIDLSLQWKSEANDTTNIIKRSKNHHDLYVDKIRSFTNENSLSKAEAKGCGERPSPSILESIKNGMPIVAGGLALVACVATAPAVVLTASAAGIYMGAQSLKSIRNRMSQADKAVEEINKSGVMNSYIGVSNFHICGQSSCEEEKQSGCIDKLYDSDKKSFIRKMWKRNKCLTKRKLSYLWDGIGVYGGGSAAASGLKKLKEMRKGITAVSGVDNIKEGTGALTSAVIEGFPTKTAKYVKTFFKRGADTVADSAAVSDGASVALSSQSDFEKDFLKWKSSDKSVPCFETYDGYERFFIELKKHPKKFSEIAIRNGLPSYMAVCVIPNNFNASSILKEPSEAREKLDKRIKNYCGNLNRTKESARITENLAAINGDGFYSVNYEMPGYAMIKDNGKIAQELIIELLNKNNSLIDEQAVNEVLKLELQNLQRIPEINRDKINQVNEKIKISDKKISSIKRDKKKIQDNLEFYQEERSKLSEVITGITVMSKVVKEMKSLIDKSPDPNVIGKKINKLLLKLKAVNIDKLNKKILAIKSEREKRKLPIYPFLEKDIIGFKVGIRDYLYEYSYNK